MKCKDCLSFEEDKSCPGYGWCGSINNRCPNGMQKSVDEDFNRRMKMTGDNLQVRVDVADNLEELYALMTQVFGMVAANESCKLANREPLYGRYAFDQHAARIRALKEKKLSIPETADPSKEEYVPFMVNRIFFNVLDEYRPYIIKGAWDGAHPEVQHAWLTRKDGTGHAYAGKVTRVKSVWRITAEEFSDMTGGHPERFAACRNE